MDGITDDDLVNRAKKGDLDADDLSQETFLHAYRALKSFRQQASFYTWLYRVAVNLTLNHLKKGNREKDKQELEIENVSEDDVPGRPVSSPDKQSFRKELRQKLKAAIEGLPVIYRTSFILVEVHGMSHNQAAFVCRCSENTISWSMHQARKMLQNTLNPYLERENS